MNIYRHVVTLKELNDFVNKNESNFTEYESVYFTTDKQEIKGYLDSVNFPDDNYRINIITGIFVISGDNDHIAIWLCEDRNNPLFEYANYHPLSDYMNSESDNITSKKNTFYSLKFSRN